jgi:tRNA dimethylallyltransferase
MLAAGLLEEVRGVLAAGFSPELRPLQAFGYREPVAAVLGRRPVEGLAEAIARDPARYAKRQVTWLRGERGVEWCEPEVEAVAERLVEAGAAESFVSFTG